MDIIRIYFDQNNNIAFEFSWLLFVLVGVVVVSYLLLRRPWHKYKFVKMNISLGGIGQVEIKPNTQDIQIAHSIWTELVTRKAAIPVDPDHDVIVEVYDSWYVLFKKIRELVSNLPAELVRKEKSTQEIVRIATATLNQGLRPHLTKWQARFRNWYEANHDQLSKKTPQELQQEFPEYEQLIKDMLIINKQLIEYAKQLKKLVEE